MTLSRSEHAASRLQAALDAHVPWNLEADIRDVVAGFAGISDENAALRKRLNAVRSVLRHLREDGERSPDGRGAALLTAADWLEEALKDGAS